jgi:hypothetical protein
MAKGLSAIIGTLLTLVFLILGFFGPWYSISGGFSSVDIGLTTGIGQSGFEYNVLNVTLYTAIFALIFAILGFIGVLGAAFKFGNLRTMKKLGGTFGLLTFVFGIIAVFYFFAYTPSGTISGVTAGVGWGWYMFLIGAIIAIISTGFCKKLPT